VEDFHGRRRRFYCARLWNTELPSPNQTQDRQTPGPLMGETIVAILMLLMILLYIGIALDLARWE
jgi:hypothetical protein